ncbi:MAG TPA: FtsX-like permease family protein [Ktedonobacterales bacterium]|nr:FtsX-like permease family protein [Ktedonobacterales bacterium]
MVILSTLRFVIKRAFHHRAILLPVLLGVLAAVTILCSVPLFSTAASNIGLRSSLDAPGQAVDKNLRIDFTTPALDSTTYTRATKQVTANVQYYLGSSLAPNAPLLRGDVPDQAIYNVGDAHHFPTGLVNTADVWFLNGMDAKHLKLTQGRFPSSDVKTTQTSQGTAYDVEAIISQDWANQFQLKLNDVQEIADETDQPDNFLRVHYVGFFQPINQKDPIWFDNLDPFTPPITCCQEPLPPAPVWIDETAFENAIPHLGLTHTIVYSWFYYLNLSSISAANASTVEGNMLALKSQFGLAASGDSSGQQATYDAKSGLDGLLDSVLQKLFFVTVATLVAILPGLALLLLYVGLAASALAERNREEIALMKSRGASTWQVLALSAIEALLLCVVSLVVAPVLAVQVTGLLTRFSAFAGSSSTSVNFLTIPSSQTYIYASVAAFLCLLTLLAPALLASRASLVTVKRETSRPRLTALAFRLAPGVLLAALGVFGFIEIRQRGAFFSQDVQGNLSVDWVAAAAPTLLLVGAAGLGLLLLPLLLMLLDRLGQRLPGISAGLALRQMARRPAPYSRLVLLLTLTIALGIFASLFSGTLVSSFADRAAYESGADLRLVEGPTGVADASRQAAPLQDQMDVLPGVTDGMNVFRAKGTAPSSVLRFADVYTLGIDSTKYQSLGYWRSDFADQPLSTLMQALHSKVPVAESVPAIIDDQLIADTGKHIGDQINIQLGTGIAANFEIVGTFHYFPTLDTSQYAIVADVNQLLQALNLNPLNKVTPNEVWFKLAPNAPQYTIDSVESHLLNNPQHKQVIVTVQTVYDRSALESSLRNDPLHFSISGALSLDFVVAALLSVIGFVVLFYVIAQRRSFEFGVLRAMGLSLRQLAGSLGWEQITLLFSAMLLGLGLGVVLAYSVLPALATDDTGRALLPPFATHMDVQAVVQLALFLIACALAALSATLVIFRRLQLHEVLRLGEE